MVTQIREKLGQEKSFSEVKKTQLETNEKMGDKPGTIWQMEWDLREAGFIHVDCIWKYLNLAVTAAV